MARADRQTLIPTPLFGANGLQPAFVSTSSFFALPQSSTFLKGETTCCRQQQAPTVGGSWARKQNPTITPQVSLAVELLFKAAQVAAATALGNSVVTTTTATRGRHAKTSSHSTSSDGRQFTPSFHEPSVWDAVFREVQMLTERLSSVASSDVSGVNRKWSKLAICIIIDLVGSGGLGLPLLGDLLDVVTAPVTAVMLHALFASPVVTIAGFTEEILPGTDGIPTATLAWLAENAGYLKCSTSTSRKLDD